MSRPKHYHEPDLPLSFFNKRRLTLSLSSLVWLASLEGSSNRAIKTSLSQQQHHLGGGRRELLMGRAASNRGCHPHRVPCLSCSGAPLKYKAPTGVHAWLKSNKLSEANGGPGEGSPEDEWGAAECLHHAEGTLLSM